MTTPQDKSYREVPLTKGQIAIVDIEDFASISTNKWYAHLNPLNGRFYALRRVLNKKTGKRDGIWMHRQILGLAPGDERQGDHVEPLATLDNRKENLRIATIGQNNRNKRKYKTNTSGFKGVSLHTASKKWSAQIRCGGNPIYLGLFETPEEAHAAYSLKAKELHKEFARVV